MAAAQSMVGIGCVNINGVTPMVAPFGGIDRRLGTQSFLCGFCAFVCFLRSNPAESLRPKNSVSNDGVGFEFVSSDRGRAAAVLTLDAWPKSCDAEPNASDIAAFENDLKGHKVKVMLYNAQASEPAVQRLVQIAKDENIPVVGVSETEPADTSYQQWMPGNSTRSTRRSRARPR